MTLQLQSLGMALRARSLPRPYRCKSASNAFQPTCLRRQGTRPATSRFRMKCSNSQAGGSLADNMDKVVTALSLSWLASGNRSLFAARCFVETVLACFQYGVSYDKIKISLELTALQQGGRSLLNPQQQDLLLTWISLVMLTLQDIGAANLASSTPQWSPETLGLLGYVKSNVTQYEQGTDLQKLQDLQAAANQANGGRVSDFTRVMQQYSLLVMLTIEVVAGLGITTTQPLRHTSILTRPTGFTHPFAPCFVTSAGTQPGQSRQSGQFGQSDRSGQSDQSVNPDKADGAEEARIEGGAISSKGENGEGGRVSEVAVIESPLRSGAVTVMISFLGAVLGSQYSATTFVEQLMGSYQKGVSARDIMSELSEEEFRQTGGLVPVEAAAYSNPSEVSAELFGRWVSIVYMVYAKIGVPFPAAAEQLGWAWTGGAAGNAVQAVAVDEFVNQTLRRCSAAAGIASPAVQRDSLAARMQQAGEEGRKLAQEAAALVTANVQVTDEGKLLVGGKERSPMVRLADDSLKESSTAVAVLQQLTGLVELAWQHAYLLYGGAEDSQEVPGGDSSPPAPAS